MKIITVCKFDPLAGHEAEDTDIRITEPLPRFDEFRPADCLKVAEGFYEDQAHVIVEALAGALPQGTLDRVTVALMAKHVSLYRGKAAA